VPVTAADPDGDAISSLTADLSGLPAGNAAFVSAPGNSSGTLTWTPAPTDSGTFTVTFTAANALAGGAATVVAVGVPNRAPVVTAPATAAVAEASPLTLTVHARDLDGDPIPALTAGL